MQQENSDTMQDNVRVLFSSTKNLHFITITEYIEWALQDVSECCFFDDRNFIIPGRLRSKMPILQKMDLLRINRKLLSLVREFQPDILLDAGGERIFPQTIDQIKKSGIKTVLWTIDAPKNKNERRLISCD